MPVLRGSSGQLGGLIMSKFCSRRNWTIEEGVYLAFGINPEPRTDTASGRSYRPPNFTNEQVRFIVLARDAVEAGNLAAEPTPAEFVQWAAVVGLHFSDAWLKDLSLSRIDDKVLPLEEANALRRARLEAKLIQDWALAPSWTLDEAAALSLNAPPEVADKAEILRRIDKANVSEFPRRLRFAERAYERGQLAFEPAPREFLDWARSVGFPFSVAWERAVPGGREQIQPQSDSTGRDDEMGKRERESLLKLVIGMAVGYYGYDAALVRNEATKQISDDLERQGIPLDRNTILKWLRAGAELLPQKNPTE